jgi:YhcH/YjgK/YiaL family protein
MHVIKMIIDKLTNINFYKEFVNHLDKGLKAIENQKERLEVGRYEFEGGFFMIQKGDTKPMTEGNFEAHRKYVDVQIVVEGSEEIAWAEIGDLVSEVAYDEQKDAEYFSGDEQHTIKVSEGMFYIAFPHDGHKAIRHTNEQQSFTKVVLKLPVK